MSCLKLKILKTKLKQIRLGIVTKNCFGHEHMYKHEESVSLNFKNGEMWSSGRNDEDFDGVTEVNCENKGKIIGIEINLSKFAVWWLHQ